MNPVDSRITDTLHRLDTPDGPVIAWGCPCGEEPDGEMAIVQWHDEPGYGIEYSYCHTNCLENAELPSYE